MATGKMVALFRRVSLRHRASTIRRLVALWAVSIMLVWSILVVGWLATENQFTQIGNRVVTDMRALSEARDLEAQILGFKRNDLLWQTTRQAVYRAQGSERLAEAQRIAVGLDPYVNTEHERVLATQIRSMLSVLQGEWVQDTHSSLQEDVRSTERLLGIVDEFQAENESQMKESLAAEDHLRETVTYSAAGLSAGTAVLLLLGDWSLMRRILRPASDLTDAVKAFGQGDFAAKAAVWHDDELGAVARTFNNMAGDIANREKDRLQFVAMVVHDLKNPALAIDMAARMLRGPGVTEEQRCCYLDGIQEEVACLRGVIRDLTDDIQVVNGRFSVQKVDLELGPLVRRFVATQSKSFATHEIVAKTAEGCTISGDADRIKRVLTNLASNAVKYSPPGTRVTLKVAKENAQVVLTISDQGPGIPKDDLDVLFQPFGRGRAACTLAEGTGMGLYVVKQIIEAHNGRIEVQSEPGRGATFRIHLPLVQAPLPQDSGAEAQAGSGREVRQ
jgi:two-component system, OmpR family, sensor histidine kinase MtrB